MPTRMSAKQAAKLKPSTKRRQVDPDQKAARSARNSANARSGGDEQAALVKWVELSRGRFPELELLIGIPNGAKLSGSPLKRAIQGKRLAREGMKKGVPDFVLPVARGCFNSLWIELKSGKARATPEQKEWIAALTKEGNRAEVCRGWQAAAALITEYLTEEGLRK